MLKQHFEKRLSLRFSEFEAGYQGTQKEYALSEDAFDNFNRLAVKLDLSRNKILQVYLEKHLDGIISHIKGNTSQRESVHECIKDAVMYLMFLDGMIFEDGSLNKSNVRTQDFTGIQFSGQGMSQVATIGKVGAGG